MHPASGSGTQWGRCSIQDRANLDLLAIRGTDSCDAEPLLGRVSAPNANNGKERGVLLGRKLQHRLWLSREHGWQVELNLASPVQLHQQAALLPCNPACPWCRSGYKDTENQNTVQATQRLIALASPAERRCHDLPAALETMVM